MYQHIPPNTAPAMFAHPNSRLGRWLVNYYHGEGVWLLLPVVLIVSAVALAMSLPQQYGPAVDLGAGVTGGLVICFGLARLLRFLSRRLQRLGMITAVDHTLIHLCRAVASSYGISGSEPESLLPYGVIQDLGMDGTRLREARRIDFAARSVAMGHATQRLHEAFSAVRAQLDMLNQMQRTALDADMAAEREQWHQ